MQDIQKISAVAATVRMSFPDLTPPFLFPCRKNKIHLHAPRRFSV